MKDQIIFLGQWWQH